MKLKAMTEYDDVFEKAERVFKLGQETLFFQLGKYFASILIKEPAGVQCLHSMADALKEWRDYNSKQTRAKTMRLVLVQMNKLFPAGEPRFKIVGKRKVRDGMWPMLKVCHVAETLNLHGLEVYNGQHEILPKIRVEILRQARTLNISLDHTREISS
jgi:hypothetical protein